MIRDTAAKRYAQAAFEIACERDSLEEWATDLALVAQVMSEPQAAAILSSPKVALADRYRLLEALLAGIDPLVMNLAKLLVAKGRVGIASQIVEAYRGLLDEHRGICHARVITAVPLADAEREAVEQRLSQITGKKVIAHLEVEPAIVGGLVARVGDRLLDGSTRSKLLALKRALEGQER
ncbi:MAG: ATP synthase F1 subunit delta [Dehalococcoidia bacterium]